MGLKTLHTLVEDVYALFDPKEGHTASEENLEVFAETIKEVMRTRLAKREAPSSPLRFSSLGKKDRQLWYAAREEGEPMTEKTYFKFLYGDIIEAMVLFLIKEAGHTVTDEQAEVDVDGVKGHIDAIIDGTVVDVKSATPFGYQKLKELKVLDDDPFGYVQQLAGYANVLTPGEGASWVAFDKVSGDLCVASLSPGIVADHPPAPRISHLREVIANDTPPERCYSDKPEGKSGNRSLATGCAYCAFKGRCWPGLRTFLYSTGPKFLTHVKEQPRVPELIAGTPEAPEVTD